MGLIWRFSAPAPRPLTVLPATSSSTSASGRTSSARVIFIWLPASDFWRCLRSKESFLRATSSSVSACSGCSKTTKSAFEMFDLLDSGITNEELPSVEAVISMFTAPLSPEMRAAPVAKTLP